LAIVPGQAGAGQRILIHPDSIICPGDAHTVSDVVGINDVVQLGLTISAQGPAHRAMIVMVQFLYVRLTVAIGIPAVG
jgi:hypothetical protein